MTAFPSVFVMHNLKMREMGANRESKIFMHLRKKYSTTYYIIVLYTLTPDKVVIDANNQNDRNTILK